MNNNIPTSPWTPDQPAPRMRQEEIKLHHECPVRERDKQVLVVDPYTTTFNGLRIDDDTYGIFGHMFINRHDIEVYGHDNIFNTSEPRNNAPLELLTVYHSAGNPYLTVYDWGSVNPGYHDISRFEDKFFKEYCFELSTPAGDVVHGIVFQNSFNFALNCNEILLYSTARTWDSKYTSKTTGLPAVAVQDSGWSVFEVKQHKTVVSPFPKVPFMLGTTNLQVMDKTGKWYKPKGRLVEESSYLTKMFANDTGSAYKGK